MSDEHREEPQVVVSELADAPEQSPAGLPRALSPLGTRRLNKMPVFVAAGAIGLAVLAVTYTMNERKKKATATRTDVTGAAPSAQPPQSASQVWKDLPPEIVGGAQDEKRGKGWKGGKGEAKAGSLPGPGSATGPVRAAALPKLPELEAGAGPGGLGAGKGVVRPAALTTATRDEQQAEKARAQLEDSANTAGIEVPPAKEKAQDGNGNGRTRAQWGDSSDGGKTPNPPNPLNGIEKVIGMANPKDDANGQGEKRTFLDEIAAVSTSRYLRATRQKPMSPFEVKQGAVIPAVLLGGVNSDLPGQLIAQVRENVYDTATGKYVLIPQGAKLVGTYDSRVTVGQERVMVAWTRVIYPDGSALDLGAMPGADGSGYAGFHDQVDNHYFKIFSAAIFMSLFSAGVQLSQPQPRSGEILSPGQITAMQLGQQTSQVGMELARHNMKIQPTLVVRPGYTFVVHVTKDIVLEPWMEQ